MKKKFLKSNFLYIDLPRDKIAIFQWILGEYDGLVQFRTIDRMKATIELMIPPGNEKEVIKIIESLKKEWQCKMKLRHCPFKFNYIQFK